ncbi:hypothetical protein OXV71_13610 [Bacteroides fragilis]|nr:hypothetical protein [Bacteroides fragilis]
MKNKQKLNINQWSKADRPREKMMAKGAEALSDAELLGILIGSGNTEESAVELMRRVLASCDNNLNELGKRRKLQESKERKQVRCSEDIYRLFHPLMCDLPQEEFWILLLNQACKVISKLRISTGGIDGTYADVRTILREALIGRATQIALIHNHPSGNAKPSQEDKRLTAAIQKASQTMNITLTDHIIVCDGCFYSFADEGLI